MVTELILPDFFKAQVIFQGVSGLSEDVYVNSFAFRNDGVGRSGGEVADAIVSRLTPFFNAQDQAAGSIAGFFNTVTMKPQVRVKVYDLGKPEPRLPIERTFELQNMGAGAPLPQETAVCLSYYAGRPLPRNRGRVYLGPLSATALSLVNGTLQVNPALMTTLAVRATGLASTSPAANVSWHLVSHADRRGKLITGGWIDNAPDNQRRRGISPSTRETWGAPPTNV